MDITSAHGCLFVGRGRFWKNKKKTVIKEKSQTGINEPTQEPKSAPESATVPPPGVLTGRLALSVVAPRLTTETIQKAACFVWIKRARSGATSPGISAHALAAEAPREAPSLRGAI